MTPSERCSRCRGLCSLRDCPERGGLVLEPEARVAPQPPASRDSRLAGNATACVAILGGVVAFGLPLWSLTGMLP